MARARKRTIPRDRAPVETKVAKKKAVTMELVSENHSIYRMIGDLVDESRHQHLAEARIAVLWNMANPREEADGRAQIYKVKRCNDQDRELAPFDFAIAICHAIWNKALTEVEMLAMLDEALCRFAVAVDKNGETKLDEKDRPVFRLAKPDVVTFSSNVHHFGVWQPGVKKLMELAEKYADKQKMLFNSQSTGEKAPKFSEPANAPKGTPAAETNGHVNGHANGAASGGKKKAAAKSTKPKNRIKTVEGSDDLVTRAMELKTGGANAYDSKTHDQAWMEGKSAFESEVAITECPYPPGDQRDDWIRGWLGGEVLASHDESEEYEEAAAE